MGFGNVSCFGAVAIGTDGQVEQNAHLALDLAHDAYLLETGHVAMSGSSETLKADEAVRKAYLGI